jgi:hypothetical protein
MAWWYVIALCIHEPKTLMKCGLTTWWPTAASEIREQFREGMHDRINQAIPVTLRGIDGAPQAKVMRGRKYDSEWQRRAIQTARLVNTRRVIVRKEQVPVEFRERLKSRLTSTEDL